MTLETMPYHLLPLVLVPVMLVVSGIYGTWWWRRHRDQQRDFANRAAEHGLRHFQEDPWAVHW